MCWCIRAVPTKRFTDVGALHVKTLLCITNLRETCGTYTYLSQFCVLTEPNTYWGCWKIVKYALVFLEPSRKKCVLLIPTYLNFSANMYRGQSILLYKVFSGQCKSKNVLCASMFSSIKRVKLLNVMVKTAILLRSLIYQSQKKNKLICRCCCCCCCEIKLGISITTKMW